MSTVENENPHAGQGMVVLDIGGDIGALVVTAPRSMIGVEIEICPAGARSGPPDDGGEWWQGDWHSHHHQQNDGLGHSHGHGAAWPHVAVLERPQGDGKRAPVAVFPGLRAGQYELWLRPAEPTVLTVSVSGGSVAAVDWPDRA